MVGEIVRPGTGQMSSDISARAQEDRLGYQGKHRQDRGRRPVLRAVAVAVAMGLVVLLGGGFLVYQHLEGNISELDLTEALGSNRPEEQVTGPKRPLNVLVMGDDTREGQTDILGDSPGLSDTTILLHLSADRSRAYGISIPRDLMVPRPECVGKDGESTVAGAETAMWNAAYAYGGPACTIKQFEELSGIRVNHFVVVKFEGFKGMVDALGGVPVCVPKEVDDPIGRIYLPAGSYEVTGQQALDYVRVRYAISNNGDIGRMARQQAFLAAMVSKAVSAGTLANPVRLINFLDAATQSLITDPGLAKLSKLADIGLDLNGIGMNKIQFFSVPFETYDLDPNRLQLTEDADQLWDELRMDETISKQFTAEATKASDAKSGKKSGGKKSGKKSGKSGNGQDKAARAAENGLCA
jgi:LCP family protein required for cell wall assembly